MNKDRIELVTTSGPSSAEIEEQLEQLGKAFDLGEIIADQTMPPGVVVAVAPAPSPDARRTKRLSTFAMLLALQTLPGCAAAPDADDVERRAPDAGTLGDTGCALDLVAEDADVTCGDVSVTGATAWIDCLGTWWVTSAYDGVSVAADDCTVVWVP